MELYERLSDLRKRAGLSQEELAERLDVSRQAVSKWESGASSPDIHHVMRLGELYQVSTDYILRGSEPDGGPNAGAHAPAPSAEQGGSLPGRGFLWLGLGVCVLLILYFITNLP